MLSLVASPLPEYASRGVQLSQQEQLLGGFAQLVSGDLDSGLSGYSDLLMNWAESFVNVRIMAF